MSSSSVRVTDRPLQTGSGQPRLNRPCPLSTPMHRSQLCADRASGRTISPMRMVRKARQLHRIVLVAMSIGVARCQRLLNSCSLQGPRSPCEFAPKRISREAAQTLAFLRADCGRRRHRFDDYCRERQLAPEIGHRVARSSVHENDVEVRLTELGPEPRTSSITAPERSISAHRCDLYIGSRVESVMPATSSPDC